MGTFMPRENIIITCIINAVILEIINSGMKYYKYVLLPKSHYP